MSHIRDKLAIARKELSLLKELKAVQNSPSYGGRNSIRREKKLMSQIRDVQAESRAIDEYHLARKERIEAEKKASEARERKMKVKEELDLSKRLLALLENNPPPPPPPPSSPPPPEGRYNLRRKARVNYKE